MATIDDIYTAIGNAVEAIVYPNGTNQPSIINADIKILKGWPLPEELDADLKNGITEISIFKTGYERKAPYFGRLWRKLSQNDPTLTATVTNNEIVIGGVVSIPQHVAVIIDDVGYHYNVQANDTLNSIATNVAALIPGALSIDNTVYISNYKEIIARIGVVGSAALNVKRQEQGFMISIWTNHPETRNALGSAIDSGLAYIVRMPLGDQLAPFRYMKTVESDIAEKQLIYRRDLYYTVEYQTYLVQEFPTITEVKVDVEIRPEID